MNRTFDTYTFKILKRVQMTARSEIWFQSLLVGEHHESRICLLQSSTGTSPGAWHCDLDSPQVLLYFLVILEDHVLVGQSPATLGPWAETRIFLIRAS